MMLRPDFTVPIVRLHMESGAACRPLHLLRPGLAPPGRPARPARANTSRPALRISAPPIPPAPMPTCSPACARASGDTIPVDLVTGDMGLILAAIAALDTAEPRKAALRRHLWRPARFQTLLRRFGAGHAALTASRAPLLAAARDGRLAALMAEAGKPVGQR